MPPILRKQLRGKEAMAFQIHVSETRKQNYQPNTPFTGEQAAKFKILENYCTRLGVDVRRFCKFILGPDWLRVMDEEEKRGYLRPELK